MKIFILERTMQTVLTLSDMETKNKTEEEIDEIVKAAFTEQMIEADSFSLYETVFHSNRKVIDSYGFATTFSAEAAE